MNWGTKIVAGMVVFMLFIIGMAVYMFSVHGNDALVDQDYYEKGIHYDQAYNAMKNVADDVAEPLISISNAQLKIALKDSAVYELKLQRPSTVKNDILMKGSTSGSAHLILVDATHLPAGRWLLELKWTSNYKDYLFKKDITL